MKRYELAVTSPEYWSEIHDALIVDSNQDGIPDRQVTCTDSKDHSAVRGTYELTEEEAAEIAAHPHVKWIELSPVDNPDSYPKPQPATKRFKKNVKFYRDVLSAGIPATSPTSAELDRSTYGVARPTVRKSGTFFSDNSGTVASQLGDVSYTLTGKNVDVVIQDSGVLQYHPEFMDANGQSRVRDIILDGPYHIDPDYFISNGYTTTRADGRVTGREAESRGWWTNSSNRSAQFQSEGTISVSSNYTEARSMGASLDGTNSLTSGHGTACASLAAGKNFGNAFEANIWNMPGISDNVSMSPGTNYDAMKIWHRLKPVNSETGKKNPTVINGSWGYQAGFQSTDTVNYKFRGTTGSFIGNASVTDQVTAMKDGLNNQISGAYRSWSTSSRSNSTEAAGNEMMLEGVIYVTSAGNNNQRLGIGKDDPDRLNYMDDDWFDSTDPRDEFPIGTVPTNHRDFLHPTGIGFDESKDFHPVVAVGALEDTLTTAGAEYQASYSNNGPGVDIWAPADETLAAGGVFSNGGYDDYERYDDSRFYDASFNGTSAASPVACGLVALFLEANPTADSRAVHNWLRDHGSTLLETTSSTTVGDGFLDQENDDTTTAYWTGVYNLRGAEPKVTYNPYASDNDSSLSLSDDQYSIDRSLTGITTTGLVMHLDGPSGFTTDLSGSDNLPTLYNDNSYNGVSYQMFQGPIEFSNQGGLELSAGLNITGGSFAIEAWIYLLGNANGGGYGQVVCQDVGIGDGQGWQWRIGDSPNYQQDMVYWTSSSRSSAVDLSSAPTSIPLNEWSQVAITYDGTDIRMYLNGVQDFIHTPASSLYGSTAEIAIGRFADSPFASNYRLNARYGAVRLYNQFLTSDQIRRHYDLQKVRFVDNAYLSFEGINISYS